VFSTNLTFLKVISKFDHNRPLIAPPAAPASFLDLVKLTSLNVATILTMSTKEGEKYIDPPYLPALFSTRETFCQD
jgi:hypothetical protein